MGKLRLSALAWRRVCQGLFLALFAWMLLGGHAVQGESGWDVAVRPRPELLFMTDPLAWLGGAVSSRSVIGRGAWLVLVLCAMTVVLGRCFCGWVCPLGALIDVSGAVLRRRRADVRAAAARRKSPPGEAKRALLSRRTKYYVLLAAAVAALLGVNVSGWMDPLAILMRACAFAIVPGGERLADSVAGRLAYMPGVSEQAAPVYYWMRAHLLSHVPHAYGQWALHLLVFAGVLSLTLFGRRYWCRVFCPLGALYGLLARVSLLRRRVAADACNQCGVCGMACRMGAIASDDACATDEGECIRCMECRAACPRGGIAFGFGRPARAQGAGVDVSRRGVLVALCAGAGAGMLPLVGPARAASADGRVLRPPGVRDEERFLGLCARCGVCYRVCPTNALHPLLFEAGPEAVWTPAVRPRIGHCEPSCVACTRSCPTGAIGPLTALLKHEQGRIGVAAFDQSRCMPWSSGTPCTVCGDMCPESPRAIEYRSVTVTDADGGRVAVRAPFVRPGRCTGCGLCENKCPLEGESAVRIVRVKGDGPGGRQSRRGASGARHGGIQRGGGPSPETAGSSAPVMRRSPMRTLRAARRSVP